MLARFERFMEQAVEGSLRRVLPTTLQPVQVAKAAARAMEEAQVIGISGVEVPNAYRVSLAAADLERLADYSARLTSELSRYLVEYARERGMRPVGELRVEVVEDARLRVGSVSVEPRFVDLAPARQSELEAAVENTRKLRLADLARADSEAQSETAAAIEALSLSDGSGLRFPLPSTQSLVRLGRAADNDVCISSQRVSRYHAQLRRTGSRWLIYDLESTNGTFLDGQRVAASSPRALHRGHVLRLGDHEINVLAGAPDSA